MPYIKPKFTFQQLLKYSPYDHKFSLTKNGFDEELFEKELLVDDLQEFLDEEANLLKAINPDEDQYKQLNFLTGYSGNGKTTFINWFRKRLESNKELKYKFYYLNLISVDYSHFDITNNKKNILINAIYSDFKEVIEKSDVFIFLRQNADEMRDKYFPNDEEWNAIWNLTIQKYDVNNTRNVFRVLSYSQLLLIWLLHYLLKEKETSNRIIFCFDNLDELDLQYISRELWKDFIQVKNQLENICSEDNFLNFNFDFINRVSFILVFREANFARKNSQFADRQLRNNIRISHFLLSKSGRTILEKRHRFAKKFLKNYDEKLHHTIMTILLNIEGKYTDRVFFPLFNYDYRKLLTSILELAEVEVRNGKEISRISVNLDDYKKTVLLSPEMGRGIFFNYIISYLIDRNNLHRFAEENIQKDEHTKLCKLSRIILTVIFNLNYPNGSYNSEKQYKTNRPKPVSLIEIIYEVKDFLKNEIFSVDELFYWLTYYFTVHKSSWSHLITIYNKENDGENFDFTKEKELAKKYLIRDLEAQERLILEQVIITINAAGITYLRYIIVHFEFHSCLISNNNNQVSQPLVHCLDFNFSELKYEFETKIDYVLKRIIRCVELMDSYFDEVYSRQFNLSVESFKSSTLSFKESDIKGKMHASRIITRQISYLDEFRRYLLKSEKFKEISSQAQLVQKRNGLSGVNRGLVNRIKVLVELLDDKRRHLDPSEKSIHDQFIAKIRQIEASDFDPNLDVKISFD